MAELDTEDALVVAEVVADVVADAVADKVVADVVAAGAAALAEALAAFPKKVLRLGGCGTKPWAVRVSWAMR